MCAIFGALLWGGEGRVVTDVNKALNYVAERSIERGRDGRGWQTTQVNTSGLDHTVYRTPERNMKWGEQFQFFGTSAEVGSVIGNMRAEPTTEFVQNKREVDQQPYELGDWSIVHNGTIANDKEIRTYEVASEIDSAAIVELLNASKPADNTANGVREHFASTVGRLRGSYAILAAHKQFPNMVLVACNYRPIWYASMGGATIFSSSRSYFPDTLIPQMVEPYSAWSFGPQMRIRLPYYRKRMNNRALVVCSGGLDSVVAAAAMQRDGYDIELLHFRYGSRAQAPEESAISKVAEALECNVKYMPMDIYSPQDSPLLRPDSGIAGGEAGAEFAFEWVPARNLVMLSLAIAYAEAKGFDTIGLGNNLEEAGAYPDNEPEFINRLNDLLPFAVRDGKRLEIVMPVGNLMKHEIVELGKQVNAPMDKTWSCYRAGKLHCGQCGPCYMRKTAFAINGYPEVINYERY